MKSSYIPSCFDKVFLNNTIASISQVSISPLDRGFLFGDSIYEVLQVVNSEIFRWQFHADRLKASILQSLIAFDIDCLPDIVRQLTAANDLQHTECFCYIQISRGEMIARNLAIDTDIMPTVFALLQNTPTLEHCAAPITLSLQEDSRWTKGHIKATNLMGATLHKNSAVKQGFDDALLFRNHLIGEATSSNFFCVIDNKIMTPKLNSNILAGVTRNFIILELKKHGIMVEECDISINQIKRMSEIWLTSTIKQFTPVRKIEDIWENDHFPVWQKCNQIYQAAKQATVNCK